jgi:hypothetical protein
VLGQLRVGPTHWTAQLVPCPQDIIAFGGGGLQQTAPPQVGTLGDAQMQLGGEAVAEQVRLAPQVCAAGVTQVPFEHVPAAVTVVALLHLGLPQLTVG